MPAPVAIVREVPNAFSSCVTAKPAMPPLDPVLARSQHAGYVAALEDGGFDVAAIPSDERFPDSPFVEDAAIVMGHDALLTRPGHHTRRGEVDAVAEVLERLGVRYRQAEAPARIDGGDVLQVGGTVFVGLSQRTNEEGVDALRDLAAISGRRVVSVPVKRVLHLKSAASALDDSTLLVHRESLAEGVFGGLSVVDVPGADPEAANVVRMPDGRILVGSHHTETASLLEERGISVLEVDVSEFARADGGLTCLSLRLRDVLASAGNKL